MWSSLLLTNISKIHLHVEQFLLKTNWKWVKGLLYNQGWKKDTHIGWLGREEKQAIRLDLCPWEGTQRKRKISHTIRRVNNPYT